MELNSKNIKKLLIIVVASIVAFLALQNVRAVLNAAGYIIGVFSPLIVGVCLAFVLNVLLKLIEEKLFAPLNKKGLRLWAKCRRPVCVVLTYIVVIALLFVLMFMILPELYKSLKMLVDSIPYYAESFYKWLDSVMAHLNISTNLIDNLRIDWDKLLEGAESFVKNVFPGFFSTTVGITSAIFGGAFDVFLGIAFSVYLLLQKERLCAQLKKLVLAFLPRKAADYTIHVGQLSNKTFARFVTGQLTEAVIIGCLCFIGMSLFKMPYAALISTIVGITSFVPILGAFIGTAIGAFLLLMIQPMTAVWFVLFIIVLQQIESNIIYPRVVGSSIGLSGLWVLVTVMAAGGMFGIAGMIIGVPLVSVAYSLLRTEVNRRLDKKGITLAEYMPPSAKKDK